MKCPFRMVTIIDKSSNKTVVTKGYAECLKSECPYFGKKEKRFNGATMTTRTVIAQKCRRIDNA